MKMSRVSREGDGRPNYGLYCQIRCCPPVFCPVSLVVSRYQSSITAGASIAYFSFQKGCAISNLTLGITRSTPDQLNKSGVTHAAARRDVGSHGSQQRHRTAVHRAGGALPLPRRSQAPEPLERCQMVLPTSPTGCLDARNSSSEGSGRERPRAPGISIGHGLDADKSACGVDGRFWRPAQTQWLRCAARRRPTTCRTSKRSTRKR